MNEDFITTNMRLGAELYERMNAVGQKLSHRDYEYRQKYIKYAQLWYEWNKLLSELEQL